MTDTNEKYAAPALEKGLDILELLAFEPEGASKSEIARRLDRTINEIFRMLAVLERRGFISAQGSTDKYALTLKMFELSHRYAPIRRLGMVSAEIMRRLSFELKQSCHLSVYYSGRGHVIAQQDAPSDVIFSVRLGVEVQLFGTCTGNILLAFADDSLRESMLREVPSNHGRPSDKDLHNMVERVRSRGLEEIASPRTAGSTDIGFPVFDHTEQVLAALVVPFLPRLGESQVEMPEVIEALRRASQEISAGLGYSPDT